MYLIKMKHQRLQRNANRLIEYTAKNITFINTDIEKKMTCEKKSSFNEIYNLFTN